MNICAKWKYLKDIELSLTKKGMFMAKRIISNHFKLSNQKLYKSLFINNIKITIL